MRAYAVIYLSPYDIGGIVLRRVRLTIEYDGTNYSGWQRQENAPSVQAALERAVYLLTGETVVITGASRTDAGVHALSQVAHFDTRSGIPGDKFSFAMNTRLPRDIRVRASSDAEINFHARFDARGKHYRYLIHNAPHASALNRDRSAHAVYPLNDARMREEIADAVGTHDFKAFAASGSIVKNTVRTIWSASVARENETVQIDLSGDGFLYNMVRILAGTLLSVGGGRMEPGAIGRAIQSLDRLDLGPTAPACGLTLMEVFY